MVRIVTWTGPIDRCSNLATGDLKIGILVSDDAIDSDHDNVHCPPLDNIKVFRNHNMPCRLSTRVPDFKGGIQDNNHAILYKQTSADSGPCVSLDNLFVIIACPIEFALPPNASPPLRATEENRSPSDCSVATGPQSTRQQTNGNDYDESYSTDNPGDPQPLAVGTSSDDMGMPFDLFCNVTKNGLRQFLCNDLLGAKRMIRAMLTFHGFILIFFSPASAFVDDCQPNQYYDKQRLVCLDHCGRDYKLICPLQDFCSSNQLWSEHYDPPFCLNRCIHACDKTSYCHHDSALCRPCDTLCDGSDVDACRAYCYDVYITLPTAAPWETCSAYEYYDFDRKVCLDRCGVDNEARCGVDQFCSTTVPWGVKIRPPACLNHCPNPCDVANYCDSISHQCRSCVDLCRNNKTDLCRMHCFDVFMNVTPLEQQTTHDSAPITVANDPVLSTDIITSVLINEVIVGVLSAAILVLMGVLVIKCIPSGKHQTLYIPAEDSNPDQA